MKTHAVDTNLLDIYANENIECFDRNKISKIRINEIKAYTQSERVDIHVVSGELLTYREIILIETDMKKIFDNKELKLKISFDTGKPLHEILAEYKDELISFSSVKMPYAAVILKDSKWYLNNDKLLIELSVAGGEILKTRGFEKFAEKMLMSLFAASVRVEITGGEYKDEMHEKYLSLRAEQDKLLNSIIEKENGLLNRYEDRDSESISREYDNYHTEEEKKSAGNKKSRHKSAADSAIYGKQINDDVIELSKVKQYTGKIFTAAGDVISTEFKQTKGQRTICTFVITDYTGSAMCKLFVKKDKALNVQDRLNKAKRLKLSGWVKWMNISAMT